MTDVTLGVKVDVDTLRGYLEGVPALLDLFLLEQAAYEICYEAANRPTWLRIPMRGLDELVGRLPAKD